jgi:hypothetical protein
MKDITDEIEGFISASVNPYHAFRSLCVPHGYSLEISHSDVLNRKHLFGETHSEV